MKFMMKNGNISNVVNKNKRRNIFINNYLYVMIYMIDYMYTYL